VATGAGQLSEGRSDVRDELPFGLSALPLVDHHCHGIVPTDLDQWAFELFINEGFERPAAGTSHFDTPIGLSVRRWCPPVLGLNPFASPAEYMARRNEVGAAEVNRRLMTACGIGTFLIDTGYRTDDILDVEGVASVAGAPAREVVRIESVEERIAADGVSPSEYAGAVEQALEEAARSGAAGFKSVVAYRGGFGFDPLPPTPEEVEPAAASWLSRPGPHRASDPVLLRQGLWAAAGVARDHRMPIQFHVGFGDPDLTLHQTDPTLLTELLKAWMTLPVDVTLLHCYPYHREAGYLASMFPNVYFDVGAMLHYLGPRAGTALAEALELAPFTKQLFSSDAFGVAELYFVSSMRFRVALASILSAWVDRGECSTADAERIAAQIAHENAERIYPLSA
jgi:predicted TIM-barrel fold metal-dependent hydrolase